MYLIIKATPFKLSTHTVIEQSSVHRATLGVQRYMVLDGSAKIVDTRDGGIQLGKFKHMTSCGENKAAIGRYVAIRWYQKPSPDACAISASNDLDEAIRDVRSSVAENKSCCHLIVDIGLMTLVRFYRPGASREYVANFTQGAALIASKTFSVSVFKGSTNAVPFSSDTRTLCISICLS